MESILTSIKKLLGIDEEYTHFDSDIIMHINTVFMILSQIGVGPSKGFRITGDRETWDDFIPEMGEKNLEATKTYIYDRVKLLFDPPTGTVVMQATKDAANELEWRLNIAAESMDFDSEEEI
jgi:hypothetical protein